MLRACVLCLAAAGLLAMPAVAQPPSAGDQVAARRAIRTFATCLLQARSAAANEILLQPYGSVAQQAVIDRRAANARDCRGAGTNLDLNAPALAGALSEAGIVARFASADLGRITALTPNAITLLNLEPRNGYEDLGLCVVRRAPAAVRAWAVSEPGSEADAAARRNVLPEVAPCVDQGQPLRADFAGLRALLSAALYRALRLTRP